MANYGRQTPGFSEGRGKGPLPGTIEERQARDAQKAKDAAKEAKKAAKPAKPSSDDRRTRRANMDVNAAMENGRSVSGRKAARVAKGRSRLD
ncbi:hypothetical protein JOF29_003243 [Kribbella aluminosa]|uniref:Plasmid stabilization protein n=1 Tax=Kribbella aluminosa TaxID=416017 RepID=A0ABS4UKJ3_9ACTN|nr:hypothetical protein [Kribbella aluminosa]MBP2352160.1 hypothetical protein [Kribbella aluminosa]